eukprot:TRINITY_DN11189_c0_g2_i1.p1 TRINITY_DN11189_c0_g2~~TRINITY_DN11189_c0_g2_i1.p1  ORF type:complete len:200 (-),score=38.19 TRINITY_DN11189_c0_g2_i1:2-601(-)
MCIRDRYQRRVRGNRDQAHAHLMASNAVHNFLESPRAHFLGISTAGVVALVLIRRAIRLGLTLIRHNPMLQQLVGVPLIVGGVGALGYGVRWLLDQAFSMAARHLKRTIRMDNKDENYNNVIAFISKIQSFQSSTVLAETYKKKRKTWKEWREELMMGARMKPQLDFQPDYVGGYSAFRYKGSNIWMWRHRRGMEVTGN